MNQITPEHRAAIDQIPHTAGPCARCGEPRVRCVVEPWDVLADVPTAPVIQYGCPMHDVWVLSPAVERDETGFDVVLRSPAAPTWAWAPPAWRPALAEAGYGLRHKATPSLMFGEAAGHVWVSDTGCLLRLPPGTTLAEIQAAYGLDAADVSVWRINGSLLARDLERAAGYYTADRRPPTEVGYAARWDHEGGAAIGLLTVVPQALAIMIEQIYGNDPGSFTWSARAELDPARAVDAYGDVVALIAAVDVADQERIAAGVVCCARHDADDRAYGCTMEPHLGPHHEEHYRGRVVLQWDERRYPRTDAQTEA